MAKGKVRVVDGVAEKHLTYTEKFAHGIFLVQDNKVALNNCKIVNIKIEGEHASNELVQRVTKLHKTGIFTIRHGKECAQYIFKDYANPADVEDLITGHEPQAQHAIRTAYNVTKTDTLEGLESLGILNNQN